MLREESVVRAGKLRYVMFLDVLHVELGCLMSHGEFMSIFFILDET
jgi:hypothetical protein